jgi:hypothetical protein
MNLLPRTLGRWLRRHRTLILIIGAYVAVDLLVRSFGVSGETFSLVVFILTAPAQTAFAAVYAFGSPWWRSLLGKALMTKALGLALLIDISLLFHWFGPNYFLREFVRDAVFGILLAGAWMQLLALLKEKFQGRRDDADRFSRPDTPRHP